MAGGHPKHPSCPSCSKALYKSADKGKPVKKDWPWAFCRNKDCKLLGVDQADEERQLATTQAGEEQPEREIVQAERVTKRKAKAKTSQPVDDIAAWQDGVRAEAPGKVAPPPAPSEPEAVRQARERIRKALDSKGKYTHNAIGLALSIVAQEMGGHDIANRLIDEYELTQLYGILKVEAKPK